MATTAPRKEPTASAPEPIESPTERPANLDALFPALLPQRHELQA